MIDLFTSLSLPVIFMLIGIVLLVKGGGWTVDAAVFVAQRFGISPLVVGFTIVAFGTSLPELLISVFANLQDSAGIALGNVLGSNIANVMLVIGVSAVIAPLVSKSPAILKDLLMMVLATSLLTFLMDYGAVSRLAGLVMILILFSYVFLQYKMAKQSEMPVDVGVEGDVEFSKPAVAYLFLFLGLIAIAAGAEFLVRGAKDVATVIGVPDAVIALSVIALGTSLPELSTCIIAVRKGHSGIVLGNIIGSNVFNILMILGITALVKPIAAGSFVPQLADFDIWVTALTSALFALSIVFFNGVPRIMGILFCGGYLAYNVYIYAMHVAG